MIENCKKILLVISTSILIHLLIIFFFFQSKKNPEKVSVIDLGTFKENIFKSKIDSKKLPKIIPEIKKKFNVEKTKKLNEKKLKKNLKFEQKKSKNQTTLKKNLLTELKKIKKETQKNVQENIQPDKLLSSPSINLPSPAVSPQKKIKQDKELFEYLNKFSLKLNKIALNSYPLQSKKRREQGKILTEIIVNRTGQIISYEIKTNRPQRLAKAANNLLKNNKDPGLKPPKHMFVKSEILKFEIKIIYKIY